MKKRRKTRTSNQTTMGVIQTRQKLMVPRWKQVLLKVKKVSCAFVVAARLTRHHVVQKEVQEREMNGGIDKHYVHPTRKDLLRLSQVEICQATGTQFKSHGDKATCKSHWQQSTIIWMRELF